MLQRCAPNALILFNLLFNLSLQLDWVMASEENEELLLNEEVVTEPTYTSLCLSSSDSQVASSSSNTHGLGSRRRVADPSKASQKIHVTILVCQILCLAFLGTVSAMYLVNHSISRGQCLMTAQYFPGGALVSSPVTLPGIVFTLMVGSLQWKTLYWAFSVCRITRKMTLCGVT